jgi:glycogen(starch) synthase
MVAHVLFTEHMAGVERHVAELSASLSEEGWQSVVITGANAAPEALGRFTESSALVTQITAQSTLGRARAIAGIARQQHVDLLHAHLGSAMVAAALAGSIIRRPVVTTAHFIRPRHRDMSLAPLRRAAYRVLLHRMSAVIAVSEAVALAVRPELGSDGAKLVVVRHGIPDVGLPPAPLNGDPPVILYAGRLEREKRPEMAIRAAGLASGEWELWMAGTGSMEPQLKRLAGAASHRTVRMLGFVSNLEPLFERATAVVIPSLTEGFGLVAVESMRAGRPVIAARSGALPEVIGDDGLIFEPDDLAGLAGAMDRLTGDRKLASMLGQRARYRYEREFRATRMARQTAAVYERALSG